MGGAGTMGNSWVTALIILLIAWRLYIRFRRLVGRQRSKVWRHWIAAILFPLLLVTIALPSMLHPVAIATLGVAVAIGITLGIVGLRTTRYETTPLGYYYTPNTHLGIALSLLMVARIAYRVFEYNAMDMAQRATHMQDFGRSPLTLAIFGTVASYYACYAIGILLWRARTPLPGAVPAQPTPPAGTL